MEEDRILGRLWSVAGLKPSRKWLEACRAHFSQKGKPFTEDNVLFQALDFDLRDVVRQDIHDDVVIESESPGIILRKKYAESMNFSGAPQSSNAKASLPSNFRACLQIEELLDVSKNAEERVALGPASRTAPSAIGNQSRRCLKMLLSDGYFENGSFHHDDANGVLNDFSRHSFSAMETSPIPNLSVHSQPGIKVVLCGPIIIRYGILMLDPSNTIVLGGSIPALIPIQKKAMELAAKKAGVGIDPTFRALVWNPEAGIEDIDEGEHESGDVEPISVSIHQQPTFNSLPNRQSGAYIEQTDHQRYSIPENPYPHISNQLATTADSNDMTDVQTRPQVTPKGTTENPYSQGRHQSHETSNPYRTSNYIFSTAQSSTFITTESSNGSTSTLNPYSKSLSLRAISTPELSNQIIEDPSELISHENREEESHTRSSPPKNYSPPRTMPTVTNISVNGVYESLSPSALTEPMNFADFHSLLEKIILDPNLYRKYEGVTFVVPCKIYISKDSSRNMAITIEKNKHYKKDKKNKDNKKYGFVMNCTFSGIACTGVVSCRLNDEFLSPYVTMSATDLRKLASDDRAKANQIVNQCCSTTINDLKSLARCHFKLVYNSEEFFDQIKATNVGGEVSIVELSEWYDH